MDAGDAEEAERACVVPPALPASTPHRGNVGKPVAKPRGDTVTSEEKALALPSPPGKVRPMTEFGRWENEPESDWGIDDLDTEEIVRTVEKAIDLGRLEALDTRDPLVLLRDLGLTKEDALLRAAVVLFGKKDRLSAEYTQCTVRAARFPGTEKSEFLDNRQFRGNAFELLASSQRFVREHLRIAGRFEPDSFLRIDEPSYPPLAVREALVNAICHRDYSAGGAIHVAMYDDRLEISSPGALPIGITPASLFAPHDSTPWNPLIAHVFFRRGVVEKLGQGTLKMLQLATDAGLPKPQIENEHGSVTVRFRPSGHVPRYVHVKLSRRHRAVLALLSAQGPLALGEIAEMMPDDARKTQKKQRLQKELQELRTFHLIECWGHGPGARWERTY